jgi:hypothetical protein
VNVDFVDDVVFSHVIVEWGVFSNSKNNPLKKMFVRLSFSKREYWSGTLHSGPRKANESMAVFVCADI